MRVRDALVWLWRRGRARGLIADSTSADREFRQRGFIACAVAISTLAILDAVRGNYPVLAVRVGWVVLGTSLLVFKRPRNPLGSTVQMWLMLAVTLAGSAGVALALPLPEALANFTPLVALPLLVALISRGDRALTAATGAACTLLVLALCEHWELEGSQLGTWVSLAMSLSAVSWASAAFIHRANTRERAWHSERLALARQLALSERRREEAERLAAIGRISAGVAHEVNNPLAFALANVAFAREVLGPSSGLDPEVLVALADADLGMKRIQQIVLDLRTFARGSDAGSRRGEARAAIDAAVQLAGGRMKMVSFELVAPEVLGVVRLDEQRLSQALINLLLNAVDAVEERCGPEGPTVRLVARREADEVCIDVEDNGPGISPEAARRLFEPFATTKPPGKGTGLGLALARELVDEAGGQVTGRNLARGARFSVRLPVLELLPSTPAVASDPGRRTADP